MSHELPSGPPRADLARLRNETVERLCRHYASDQLDEGELEARLDQVYRARARQEIDIALRGLPDLPPAVRHPEPPIEVPDRGFAVAVMGATERKGDWTPARRQVAVAVMGGVEMDFRDARLSGVTEIFCVAFWGGVEIIVPPNVRVESNGIAIMGGFENQRDDPADPDAPILRIGGIAAMGGVEILRRYPGETAREARARRKLARRSG